jgi:hypothetical protein
MAPLFGGPREDYMVPFFEDFLAFSKLGIKLNLL